MNSKVLEVLEHMVVVVADMAVMEVCVKIMAEVEVVDMVVVEVWVKLMVAVEVEDTEIMQLVDLDLVEAEDILLVEEIVEVEAVDGLVVMEEIMEVVEAGMEMEVMAVVDILE